jgi:hypothetical protein
MEFMNAGRVVVCGWDGGKKGDISEDEEGRPG